ncbi:MAG TPA: RNA polymerase sigma factor [Bradyrhizobium sp.]|nr:RNA polymerase sigma factor [Bradyrhizobium sp.]
MACVFHDICKGVVARVGTLSTPVTIPAYPVAHPGRGCTKGASARAAAIGVTRAMPECLGELSRSVMKKNGLAQLMQVLMDDYDVLKRQIARRVGSPDIADDLMQEAYLRLQRMGHAQPLQHPKTYLFRIVLNLAADRRRSDARRLARSEAELLLRLEHDELDPERIAAGRSAVRLLAQAIEELAPRRRAIFIAARLEGVPYKDIAARFGISTRYLERELKQALDHVRTRLQTNSSSGSGSGRSGSSND